MNLYIMCGLAFSGKSTLARKIAEQTGSKRIAFDELWVEKDKEQPVPKGDEGWKFIRLVGQKEVAKALQAGQDVVYDDNNVRFEHREELREVARRFGARAVTIYLKTPMELIREREAANRSTGERHEVEPANFQKVVEQMQIPRPEENVVEFAPSSDLNEFIQRLK
ncbi:ATP-binding protein [Candidatus Microgenomates bacterium]|nr:ATP-binding protein [Candidatus Microgenomates bacterium]